MYQKFTEKEKESIVTLYSNGQSAVSLCSQYDISRSTLYSWINRYQKIKAKTHSSVSYKEHYDLKRHADKLSERLEVIKAAGCGVAAPLQERLVALEAARPKTGYTGFDVEALHRDFAATTPRIGLWIDNSRQTPEETVRRILKGAE